jgi:hypothetical protein
LPNPQMTVRRMEEAIADRSLPIRLTYADGFVSPPTTAVPFC